MNDMMGQNTLAAFTGMPQIDLINDWSHVFAKANWGAANGDAPDDGNEGRIVKVMEEWQTELKALANQISELNIKRGHNRAQVRRFDETGSGVAVHLSVSLIPLVLLVTML